MVKITLTDEGLAKLELNGDTYYLTGLELTKLIIHGLEIREKMGTFISNQKIYELLKERKKEA